MEDKRIKELKQACVEMRQDVMKMAKAAGSSGAHFGGTLSMIEIAAALYLEVMNISKDLLEAEERDRFILSKGHGVPAVYAALKQLGILTPEQLDTFKQNETILYGHPCMNAKIGIEYSTGSLGQGLSLGVGAALAMRHKKNETSRVFVVLGDGECDEGSIWEAAMSASQFELHNLVVIIDRNKLQYDGSTEEVLKLESLEEKWNSFGWETITIDGHSVEECCEAFSKRTEKPLVVIAQTIKGKGISFMENDPTWHHKKMSTAQEAQAMEEIVHG